MSCNSRLSVAWLMSTSLSNLRTNCLPTQCLACSLDFPNNVASFALCTNPHTNFLSLMTLYSMKGAQFCAMSVLFSNPTTLHLFLILFLLLLLLPLLLHHPLLSPSFLPSHLPPLTLNALLISLSRMLTYITAFPPMQSC